MLVHSSYFHFGNSSKSRVIRQILSEYPRLPNLANVDIRWYSSSSVQNRSDYRELFRKSCCSRRESHSTKCRTVQFLRPYCICRTNVNARTQKNPKKALDGVRGQCYTAINPCTVVGEAIGC